jgi:hypothetical protein
VDSHKALSNSLSLARHSLHCFWATEAGGAILPRSLVLGCLPPPTRTDGYWCYF